MVVLHGGPGGSPDQIVNYYKGGLVQAGVISVYPRSLTNQLLDWNYPHSGAYLLEIVKQVASEYRVDPKRIYLTGVSMGGGGSWVQGALGKDFYAAIGPVSGWFGASQSPGTKLLKDMPIYIMHGGKDRNVPASRSDLAVGALKNIGRQPLVKKELPKLEEIAKADAVYRHIEDGKHNCFEPWKSRGSNELGVMMKWMLLQKREDPADPDATIKLLAEHGKRFGWQPGLSPIGGYKR
ncbi:MAG: dienelactone hydrolase family protein [Phycisphaerae bacterium]